MSRGIIRHFPSPILRILRSFAYGKCLAIEPFHSILWLSGEGHERRFLSIARFRKRGRDKGAALSVARPLSGVTSDDCWWHHHHEQLNAPSSSPPAARSSMTGHSLQHLRRLRTHITPAHRISPDKAPELLKGGDMGSCVMTAGRVRPWRGR